MTTQEKREFLESRGWSLYYNDDYWVNPKTVREKWQDYTNYGMNTEPAYKYETENENPFPPFFEGIVYGRDGKQ